MSTLEIKNEIAKKLATIEDSSFLNNVLSYIDNLKDAHYSSNSSKKQIDKLDKRSAHSSKKKLNSFEEIVAYSINGKPISKKEYIQRNEQAVASYKKGNFKTQKEILDKYQKSI